MSTRCPSAAGTLAVTMTSDFAPAKFHTLEQSAGGMNHPNGWMVGSHHSTKRQRDIQLALYGGHT
jgi:hypothetical protein